jgi:hypothetical protein
VFEQEATREPDWPTCGTEGCIGMRTDGQQDCLAHIGSQTRKTILAALEPGADLDLRGTPIDAELLSQILAALRPQDGHPTLGGARFDRAQFNGDADFKEVQFTGIARFRAAQFNGSAWFTRASFGDDVEFNGASFDGSVQFDWSAFERPLELGPIMVNGTLSLDHIVFEKPVQVEVASIQLSCRRTRFRAGGHLRVAWAQMTLEDAEVPAPLIISYLPRRPSAKDPSWVREVEARTGKYAGLVSVQRADVAGLVLTDIGLAYCHFAGAHHLEQLQLSSGTHLSVTVANRWATAA